MRQVFCACSYCLTLLPQLPDIQDEAGQNGLTIERGRIITNLNGPPRAVDMDTLFKRIDQPAEPGTGGKVFLHFFLQGSELVLLRAKLDHKVGTQRGKAVLLGFGQSLPAGALQPRSIR